MGLMLSLSLIITPQVDNPRARYPQARDRPTTHLEYPTIMNNGYN
jgi:hypothetical protein